MSFVDKAIVSSTAHNTPGSRDDWETPQALFDKLDDEFSFDMDAAATDETAKCRYYIDKERDALSGGVWVEPGQRVWLNPPYGRGVGRWIEEAYRQSLEGATVVVLTFARTDTKWWHSWAMKAAEIRFIKGRLRFSIDGETADPAPAPSCLLVFTPWSSGPPSIRSMCQ